MPTLLLDKKKCLGNIERMALKAESKHLSFRPHFKTHQSVEVGSWFREFGVSKIAVSSFSMATKFAAAGWTDILVAFPFNPLELPRLNTLGETTRISILLDNIALLPDLVRLEHDTAIFVDIDTGYGRTGIKAENRQGIANLISAVHQNPRLHFRGFYCHAGHSYKAINPLEKEQVHQKAIRDLQDLKKEFAAFSPMALYGDTPNCSTRDDFTGIDELTPGNFVFYDLTQVLLGSCTTEDIAVVLECPVTGLYEDKRRILLHGGGVHFSKESLHILGREVFGLVVTPTNTGWSVPEEKIYLSSLSQEHGLIEIAGELFDRVRIGDLLPVLPVHSCMTANLMKEYRIINA